jgi:hypothetical protein
MRHGLLASMLVGILSLSVLTVPAHACLNDRETKTRETEFKLQYPTRSIDPGMAAPTSEEGPNYLTYVLIGTGGFLGTAGLGMGAAVGFVALRKTT